MQTPINNITIIGAGQVGSAFALAFQKKRKRIVGIISRTRKSAKRLANVAKAPVRSNILAEIPAETQVIVLAVPSEAIRTVVTGLQDISHIPWKNVSIFHTSGADSAELLEPLARLGANIAAIHPIQTFPRRTALNELTTLLRGIPFGIDAPKRSIRFAKEVVRLLDGKPIVIPSGMKPLYHAMCVFSSGYVVELLRTVEELCSHLEIREPWHTVIGPLLRASIENAMTASPAKAETGPMMRGDRSTLLSHIDALTRFQPDAVDMYKSMAAGSLNTALETGAIDRKTQQELTHLLGKDE